MIDLDVWKKNVCDSLNDIADKKFQRRTWLHDGGKEFSSPAEVYCYLMNDNIFDNFIEESKLHYNNYQKKQAYQFIKELDNYYDSQPGEYYDPKKILDDPQWDIIGQKALQLIDTLNLGKYKNPND